MISLEKQIELLADFSINYSADFINHGGWRRFFDENDIALPFCALKYLKFCEWPEDEQRKIELEILIRTTFFKLCDELNLDRGRKHLSIPDMLRNSTNEEVIIISDEQLEALRRA